MHTRTQLDGLRALKPDWDSYGGLPPTEAALRNAAGMLSGFATIGYHPVAVPCSDGGVQLEWHGKPYPECLDGDLEVRIGPDGKVTGEWVWGCSTCSWSSDGTDLTDSLMPFLRSALPRRMRGT